MKKKSERAGAVASRTDGYYQNLLSKDSSGLKKDKDNHAADVKAAETPTPSPQKGVEISPAPTTAGDSSPLHPVLSSLSPICPRTSPAILVRWKFAPDFPKINPGFAILEHLSSAKHLVLRVNKAKGGLEVFFRDEKSTLAALNFLQQNSSIRDGMTLTSKYLYPGIRTEIRTIDTCTSAGFLLTEEMLSQSLSKLLGENYLSVRPDYLFIKDTSVLSGFSVYTRREMRKTYGDPDTFEVIGPNNARMVCQLVLQKRKEINKPAGLPSSRPSPSPGPSAAAESAEVIKAKKAEKNKKKRDAKKEKKKNLAEAVNAASPPSAPAKGGAPQPSTSLSVPEEKSSATVAPQPSTSLSVVKEKSSAAVAPPASKVQSVVVEKSST
jgi:hypothetical protein